MGRRFLLPDDAANEGQRELRKVLLRRTRFSVARALQIDERTLSNWVSGRRHPRPEGRVLLEEVLGINAALWFIPRPSPSSRTCPLLARNGPANASSRAPRPLARPRRKRAS